MSSRPLPCVGPLRGPVYREQVSTYKRLHKNQKLDVDAAVEVLIHTPEIGEPKRGDLAGVYVYKFKTNAQLMLLTYEYDPATRTLLLLGNYDQ